MNPNTIPGVAGTREVMLGRDADGGRVFATIRFETITSWFPYLVIRFEHYRKHARTPDHAGQIPAAERVVVTPAASPKTTALVERAWEQYHLHRLASIPADVLIALHVLVAHNLDPAVEVDVRLDLDGHESTTGVSASIAIAVERAVLAAKRHEQEVSAYLVPLSADGSTLGRYSIVARPDGTSAVTAADAAFPVEQEPAPLDRIKADLGTIETEYAEFRVDGQYFAQVPTHSASAWIANSGLMKHDLATVTVQPVPQRIIAFITTAEGTEVHECKTTLGADRRYKRLMRETPDFIEAGWRTERMHGGTWMAV